MIISSFRTISKKFKNLIMKHFRLYQIITFAFSLTFGLIFLFSLLNDGNQFIFFSLSSYTNQSILIGCIYIKKQQQHLDRSYLSIFALFVPFSKLPFLLSNCCDKLFFLFFTRSGFIWFALRFFWFLCLIFRLCYLFHFICWFSFLFLSLCFISTTI